VGLLSPDGRRETAVPVAICGNPQAPNRVILVGDQDSRFGAGELIAEDMRREGVCVIVSDTPEIGADINALAAASLGGEPTRVILLDPDDTAGEVTRGMFRDRAGERARELAELNVDADPLMFSIVGKAELARFHEYGPRTVAVVVDCLRETMLPAPVEPTAVPPPTASPRSAVPEPGVTPATGVAGSPPSSGTRRSPGRTT